MVQFYSSETTATSLKLHSFKNLSAGWHYGGGGPIGEEVVKTADQLLTTMILHGITRTQAFPGSGGEVLLAGYRGEHYLALMVYGPEHIDCSHEEDGNEVDEKEGLNLIQARHWLIGATRGIWNLSDLFTQVAVTTTNGDNLMISHSRILVAAGECQSSTVPAAIPQAA